MSPSPRALSRVLLGLSIAARRYITDGKEMYEMRGRASHNIGNDPSAGSPTETLLRLLLPLNAQVWESFRATREAETSQGPVQIPH